MAGDSTVTIGGDDVADGDPRLSAEYVRTIEVRDRTGGLDGANDELDNRYDESENRNGELDGGDRELDNLDEELENRGDELDDLDEAPEGLGTITLVGVVHDHPSSVYRVQQVAAGCEPDVLALELPPLAVPLFERYARDVSTPPATGGEMSAAIQATDAKRTVGIDGPTPGFAARLGRHLLAERPPRSTARAAIGRFARASCHAVACRAASVLVAVSDREPELSAPREHAVVVDDPPEKQARDEHKQVRLARSVAAAFGADRSVATRDELREAHMADRLASLAESGGVVAVVGVDHVESVAERLEE